jgi:beta-lactamase regulating signal transducer with metallopeptidase domain/uncharacterized GH25 family protein/cytochrome oxidase Cu insertion factor (SCO1/SenC/PrrC family)
MNTSALLNWLLRTSWQASILVVLVLAAQWLFRRRLSARWQYSLWFLVVIRLAMPSLPSSSWSVFNVIHYSAAAVAPPPVARELERPPVSASTLPAVIAPLTSEYVESRRVEPSAVIVTPRFDKEHWLRNAAMVWVMGLLLLAGRSLVQNLVFLRRLNTAELVTDAETLALFGRCREIMGISCRVPLVETAHVKSPALYGFFRPTLLLPIDVMRQFNPAEQRHIFLHELAHVKRRDMAVHWVATVFRMMHWFNPLLWFGFARMAADRELACDELALAAAGEQEARPYGQTVLKLLEICACPAVWPGLMGILEEKSQMARRILRIARYKQQTNWPVLAVALLAALGLVTLTDAQTEKGQTEPASASTSARSDLTGEVYLANGQPGVATIFIATAKPKTGTSTFCPSCYADCVKSAKADAQGHFKIDSLDPTLLFQILVVAKDCAPQYVANVDPGRGPVIVKLEPRNYAQAPPGNTLRGRVVDTNGAPIAGAEIEAGGIRQKDGSATWVALEGVDPLAVSDEKGEFLITSVKPFASMDVNVEARGFARKTFTELRSGTTGHDLTMTEGATVSGRVTWNGKPLAGVSVGIVSTDRTAGHTTVHFEIGTDADGRFAFMNLPPNDQYNVYGIMQSLKNYGAVMPSQVSTSADGSKADAGDLVVVPAHRLAGGVVLDDSQPIPAKTRLLIGREDAWDSLQVDLDAEGHFDTKGIPSGLVDVGVRVPGYRISRKNASLDVLNPFRLLGRVDEDITNLIILLEKGPALEADYASPPGEWPPRQALRGTEGGRREEHVRPQSWTISGRVTDAKTGQPVPTFQVTPGNKLYGEITSDPRSGVAGSNGVYVVEVSKRFAKPVLKIIAEGYLPAAVTAPQENKTNFDLALEPGQGPAGVVLLPDGKAAANVTVALVCAGQQGIGIRDGKIESWRAKNLVRTTDAGGHFSFTPELQMECLAAASPDGFKLVSLAELAADPKTVLEPWGRVKGTLSRPSGPGTNEELDLGFTFDSGNHTITDEMGRFEFDRVPPGKLELTYRVKVGANGWQNEPLQSIAVKHGQTLELKIEGPARAISEIGFGSPQPKPARPRGAAISGTVNLPGGKPAAGVQVALIAHNEYLGLQKGSLQTGKDTSVLTITDRDGHFTLPGVEGAMGIVAAAETGFARIALSPTNSHVLTLQSWGEIRGTLRIGRRLGTNQTLHLQADPGDGLNYDFNEYEARTDDQGKFVITYAPPGAQRLIREIPGAYGNGISSHSAAVIVNVKSGEVTKVTIGGNGREVIGKAVFADPADALDWKEVRYVLQSHATGTNLPAWKSPFFPAEPATNDSFVFEDVAPGTYDLVASAPRLPKEPHIINHRFMNSQILGGKEVAIPEAGAPAADAKPCDVGTLNLRTVHPLNVGDAATPVEAETPEGQKFHLADYRGKFVLLNILYGFELPSDLPQLKEAFEAYGKDDRFAVLSVTYASAKTLDEFARTNDITWPHGSLGSRYLQTQFEDYIPFPPDVNHSQLSYLIDPEGKIVATNLHGAAINDAVAKALAKR